jgi:hypothetical protein
MYTKEADVKENTHIHAIPEDALQQVQTKLDEIMTLLSPYLTTLRPEQRRELPKLGEKTLEFVEKALQYAKDNPGLTPNFLKVPEFETDLREVQRLWSPVNKTEQLFRELDDTLVSAGSEAYQAALVFYKYVKLQAEQQVPGARVIYEDLKSRFTFHKSSSKAAV